MPYYVYLYFGSCSYFLGLQFILWHGPQCLATCFKLWLIPISLATSITQIWIPHYLLFYDGHQHSSQVLCVLWLSKQYITSAACFVTQINMAHNFYFYRDSDQNVSLLIFALLFKHGSTIPFLMWLWQKWLIIDVCFVTYSNMAHDFYLYCDSDRYDSLFLVILWILHGSALLFVL